MLKSFGFAILLAALGPSASSNITMKASQPKHYPNLVSAEMPLYPSIARSAHITGTVEVEIDLERGSVVAARLKSSSSPLLANPSMTNVKTWRFDSNDPASFTVIYVYEIKGKQTRFPENPKVQLDLPRLVRITARPFKPTCSDC
jgi:hypothetical protein